MSDTTEQKDILRGGQFLVKETSCDDVFTPEDFNEEQKMMRDSVKEFVDREIIPHKERFEKKDYALTEEIMQKAGELGFLGVAVPEEYDGLGMGFVSTMLVAIISRELPDRLLPLLEHIPGLVQCRSHCMVPKSKRKNMYQN